MALGVLSGFNPIKVSTTAKTVCGTAGASHYMTARLVANATAGVMQIFNSNNGTAAATLVASLKAAINSADELGAPIRCGDGVTVKISVNTCTGFIYLR